MVVVGVCAVLLLVFAPDRPRRISVFTWVVASAVLALVALLVFQHWYWGDWLPNTYRLKVDGIPVADRLTRGFFAALKVAPVFMLVLGAWYSVHRHSRLTHMKRSTDLLFAVIVVVGAYSVWVGGDAWEWTLILNRYLAVVLPTAVALVFVGLTAYLGSFTKATRLTAVFLVVLVLSGVGYGVTVNPLGISWRASLAAVALLSVATVAFLVAIRRLAMDPSSSTLRGLAHLATALVVVVAAGGPPMLLWVGDAGAHVRTDQHVVGLSLEMRGLLYDDATIATFWAGAPGYFSKHPMIDLLGKSDRVIAQMPPAVDPASGKPFEFLPGHNRWDFDYSIGQLKPDAVFAYGNDLDAQMMSDWGYVASCLSDGSPIFLQESSAKVRWDLVRSCG